MRRSILLAALFVTVVVAAASAAACRGTSSQPAQAPAAEPGIPAGAPALLRSRDGAPTTASEPVAPAPGGLSIADVWAKRAALNGTEITVRGRVVKVNTMIMGRNWVHLQDGSGAEADGTHDLTITTDAQVAVGDTVTFTGVLAADRDFGSGYAYAAILEQARVIK